MPVRLALSFDHLDNTLVSTHANWAKVMGSLPVSHRPLSGSAKPASIASGGWITSNPSGVALTSAIGLNAPALIADTPKKSWFGVRLKMITTGSAVIGDRLLTLNALGYTGGTTSMPALTCAQLGASMADILNKEFYVELGINWISGEVERWVDGIYHSTVNVNSNVTALQTLYLARNVAVFMNTTINAWNQTLFKDIYWLDETDDPADIKGPLGPQRCTLMEEVVVEPTAWTPVGASLSGVLSRPITAATPEDALINGVTDPDPLRVKLVVPAAVELGKVHAVHTLVSAGLVSGGATNLSVAMEQGGSTSASTEVQVTTTMGFNRRGPLIEKAPDGSRWTRDKLNSAVLTVDVV